MAAVRSRSTATCSAASRPRCDPSSRRWTQRSAGCGRAGAGVSSLRGWPTADAFSGNAANAHSGCLNASVQAGDGQQAAAGNLSDSAATYDVAESDSTQAVHGVATALGG